MNPPTAVLLFVAYVLSQALAVVVAYRVWREKQHESGSKRHLTRCAASGAAGLLLVAFGKWLNAAAGSLLDYVGMACAVVAMLLFGACEGYFFAFWLDVWRWHKRTRLKR